METEKIKNGYLTMTKSLLFVMFWLGVICTPGIVAFLVWYGKNVDTVYYGGTRGVVQVILYFVAGIFCTLIVYELRKMITTVEQGKCFVKRNVVALKRMSIYSFVAMAMALVRLVLYVTPGPFAMATVFLLAGLMAGVLANVFAQAVDYKEENDFTI